MARIRRRPAQGFEDTPDVLEVPGAQKHIPTGNIEAVLERYHGAAIPLDALYPDPPKPRTALPETNPAPRRNLLPTPAYDDEARNIATDEAYRKEARLKLVHRFILRGADVGQIAEALSISAREVYALRSELHRRMGEEASSIDFPTFVGQSLGFYNELRASAMRGFDTTSTAEARISHRDRQGYLAIAKAAEDSKNRLLQVAGFFDNVKLQPKVSTGDAQADEMADMQRAMRMMLDPSTYINEIDAIISDETGVYSPDEETPDERIRVL